MCWYTCLESALIISERKAAAIPVASFVLPLAVGPSITIRFGIIVGKSKTIPLQLINYKIMVKHIVFWKLKETANGMSKAENALAIKHKLEGLKGKIDGLLEIEVGFDFLHSEESVDIVLYSTFADKEALAFYQQHPLHKAVMPFIGEARSERRVVDYEI
jgi:hypothetical protein